MDDYSAICVNGDEGQGWVHFEFRSSDPRGQHVALSSTMGAYPVNYVRTVQRWRMHERLETSVSRDTASYFAIPEG